MELLESFERGLAIHRRSQGTIQGYSRNIKEFLDYFPEPAKVGVDELEEYLECLMRRNLKGTTLKNVFSRISSFYEFLIYKLVLSNPISGFRKRYLDNTEDSDRRQIPEIWQVRELVKRLEHILEIAIT